MGWLIEVLRRPWVQRGVRAALATALAWQVAVRTSDIADDEGFSTPGAVTVGMQRSLQALEAHVRFPEAAAPRRG